MTDKGLRVLILEDNETDARLAQFELEEAGIEFTARVVAGEEDFIEALQTFSPDIILSDYNLPQYTGAMALAEARKRCPDVPFILVTGAISEERAIEVLTSGARDYVMKTRINRLVPAVLRSLAEAKERKARKKAEQDLRKAHRDLEVKVRERTAELQKEIEERRRAEDALRQSEERYRGIFENAPFGIFHSTVEGKIVNVNPMFAAILGYDSPEELIDAVNRGGIAEVLYENPSIRPAYIEKALESRRWCSYEGRCRQKDGRIITVTLIYRIFDGRGGDVPDIEGFITDITERKHSEEELKASYSLLEATLESTADGILVVDRKGKVLNFNGKFLSLWRTPESESVSGTDIQLINSGIDQLKDPGRFVETVRRIYSLPDVESYDVLEFKDGRILERYSHPQRLGDEIVGRVWSFRDITERMQAEEKYRNIFDNALDGISLSTLDGRYLSVNPAFAEIFGYDSPDDVIRSIENLARTTFVRPEERLEYLKVLQEKGFVKNFVTERYRKDGSRIWVSSTSSTVRDETGAIVHIESFTKDITELKALENQLFEAQKMEAMGTLAGGIAHDFNNILGSIIGFTELAAEQPDESARRHCIEQVLKACDRAKNLVRQILAFSRRTENEKKPIDLRLITKEALKLLSSAVPATIEIQQGITSEMCTINADPTQMHQILMNLCTNAVQAMGEQGGTLVVGLAHQEIEEGMSMNIPDLKPGSYIRLTVADTGHGIDPAIMGRIFDPFFTTKKIGEGTGLGLAVVYGIVKSHDGAITVTSAPERGTTFVVYIPSVDEALGKQGAEASDEPIPTGRGRERILFVDDEKALAELGRRLLTSLGYEVVAYTDSSEALDALRANPERFDLVITDMTMPHMTGKDLARGILELRPDMPIIICTGHSEYLDVNKALELGIKALIMKPISKKDLARAVREALDNARPTERGGSVPA